MDKSLPKLIGILFPMEVLKYPDCWAVIENLIGIFGPRVIVDSPCRHTASTNILIDPRGKQVRILPSKNSLRGNGMMAICRIRQANVSMAMLTSKRFNASAIRDFGQPMR